ncbi:MAG: YggS family pyridoxal phosphate-dependent enzyme [Bacteroidia bacterium]|nr:YggS family pyridoxal phosphate-dependent enzyme [Bacteroidia bacterium]
MNVHIDMNALKDNLQKLKNQIPTDITIIAVSKFQPIEKIKALYDTGHRDFGENYVQELVEKYEQLPKDIRWHFVGHLQSNKVKYIASFIHLIHGVDNLKLLKEINKQAAKYNRTVSCLLQIHIAKEETKFGLSKEEYFQLISSEELKALKNIKIIGLMGMATNTDNQEQIKKEFTELKELFDYTQKHNHSEIIQMQVLSMGMSNDYSIAIECGSNMIRIGTLIFGERKSIHKI